MKTVRWFALLVAGNLAATVSASTVLTPTAFATSPENADAVIMSQATVDGVDYITREITIKPGGSTGWHYHDGRCSASSGRARSPAPWRTVRSSAPLPAPRS
jgi:hypothetical protein